MADLVPHPLVTCLGLCLAPRRRSRNPLEDAAKGSLQPSVRREPENIGPLQLLPGRRSREATRKRSSISYWLDLARGRSRRPIPNPPRSEPWLGGLRRRQGREPATGHNMGGWVLYLDSLLQNWEPVPQRQGHRVSASVWEDDKAPRAGSATCCG